MKYRAEIDGLRAIAVLPVIFFHAGFKAFEGGFVGVDVFFVISGYLITTIILSDLNQGRFSIVNFYERRARRILPVLFFVMLCCLPVAWFCLLPNHLIDFCQSLMAVSTFSSNILFWSESGYFATAAELKPLLHTWSLSVEEQYYVLFPLFLMGLWKLRKKWIFASLIVAAVISFVLAQWGAYHAPKATFFLLPTRGWELAIGALIAFYFLYKKNQAELFKSRIYIKEALGLLGIILIIYSVFAFSKSTPFPSVYALVPTVGTALIVIFSTSETLAGRLLSSKLMVGVGLVSYSAYLWHQPLFAFARHKSLAEPSPLQLTVLSILSIILAFFSWRFVEVPFRNKNAIGRKKVIGFAVFGSMAFFVAGGAGALAEGWPERINEESYRLIVSAREENPNTYKWMGTANSFIDADNSYRSEKRSPQKKRYLYLVGDSHAEALAGQLEKHLENTPYGFMTLSYTGCPPVEGLYRKDLKDDHKCYEYNEDIYKHIEANDSVEYVVLMARWGAYLEGSIYENGEGAIEYGSDAPVDLIVDGIKQNNTTIERKQKVTKAYRNSIEYLLSLGKKVILVYPVPTPGWDVPDYLLKNVFIYDGRFRELDYGIGSIDYQKFKARNLWVHEAFDSIKKSADLYRVYPEKLFCNSYLNGRCVVHNGTEIFYRDDDHLSFAGADLVSKVIVSILSTENNGAL